jgi:hypothetical protein
MSNCLLPGIIRPHMLIGPECAASLVHSGLSCQSVKLVLSLSKEPALSLSKEPALSLSKEPALSLSKGCR